MKIHPSRTLHIAVAGLKLNFLLLLLYLLSWTIALSSSICENVFSIPRLLKVVQNLHNLRTYCKIHVCNLEIKRLLNPLNFRRFECVTCLDCSVQLMNKNKCLPKREEAKELSLNLQKPRVDKSRSWKLNSELEENVVNTDNWFSEDTDVFPGSEDFALLRWKKKRHSGVKEQNILLLLSNESITFQKGNFSGFRNFVFQESRTYSTPAGRCFHPKCLAVLFASVKAEPITAFSLVKLKIFTENEIKYTRITVPCFNTAWVYKTRLQFRKSLLVASQIRVSVLDFSGFGRQMFTWTNIEWIAQDDRNSTREFSSRTAFPFKSSTKAESFPRFPRS